MYNNLTDIVKDLKTGMVKDITVSDQLLEDGRNKGWIARDDNGFLIVGTEHRVNRQH